MIRSPQVETEQQIIELLNKGDRNVLTGLYDKYAPSIFGIIIRITGDEHLAERCLLNSFNEIWNQRTNYNSSKEKLFTWMVKIAKTSTSNIASAAEHCDPELREAINLLFGFNVKQFISQIDLSNANLEKLGVDKDQQVVLDLIYLKDYTCADVAVQFNMPLDILKANVIKAIKQLKRLY